MFSLSSDQNSTRPRFSALQRAENSSIREMYRLPSIPSRVSVLFSEPKIPQFVAAQCPPDRDEVSVLFSEPKIPQSQAACWSASPTTCGFSALQRAENSSIRSRKNPRFGRFLRFSALQRAENSSIARQQHCNPHRLRFSALQRAENSSIRASSASRSNDAKGFSALQRAENSSMYSITVIDKHLALVSVLFSEPKIPQCDDRAAASPHTAWFQCSSASRKFLNG